MREADIESRRTDISVTYQADDHQMGYNYTYGSRCARP
nr:hypothetical protein [Kibdelosporangium sp. MJ126-NF4]